MKIARSSTLAGSGFILVLIAIFSFQFSRYRVFASSEDAEIKEFCSTIIAGQQTEIDQMNAKLAK